MSLTRCPITGDFRSGRLELSPSGTVSIRMPGDDPHGDISVRLGPVWGEPLGNRAWDLLGGDAAEFARLEADLDELRAAWCGEALAR